MSEKKLNVAVIAGGKSAEREVSLSSGKQVMEALDKEKYNILFFDPAYDLVKIAKEAQNIDVAIIMLHGRGGEDGTMQGFLDCLGIPYQGSSVLGSSIAMNKIVSKQLYASAGLPVAPYVVLEKGTEADIAQIEKKLGFPVMVKPEQEGSSIGLTLVKSPEELEGALNKAWQYDSKALVEKYLQGTEITAAVLGNNPPVALPLVEIRPSETFEFFDYTAKYKPGATEEICPAPLPEALVKKAQDYALRAHKVLHCLDYSRTDMILYHEEFYILETNTIPGMTATSLFPQAAQAAGISFPGLLDRLIELALEKKKG